MITTTMQSQRRRRRTRAKISGTANRPRLSVRVSNRHLTAQLVDDVNGLTLGYVTTVKSAAKGTMTAKGAWVGQAIASAAKKRKINGVVFDRGGKLYHGRLHALAEAARQEGLKF